MRSGAVAVLPAAIALALQGASLSPAVAAASGPSFDCSRVTSAVNRTICASPSLSAADRRLDDLFDGVLHQGGVDGAALRADEAHWLATVRNACTDDRCLARVYAERVAALSTIGQRAASPAAYDETRPFAASPAVLAKARAHLGRSCARDSAGDTISGFPGFSRPKGFLPVTFNGGYVLPLQSDGVRFAFLLTTPGRDLSGCRVADVVVLPPPKPKEAFLQCSLEVAQSNGFGMRQEGRSAVVGYWTVDIAGKALRREPVGVLGGPSNVRCQEPETGD